MKLGICVGLAGALTLFAPSDGPRAQSLAASPQPALGSSPRAFAAEETVAQLDAELKALRDAKKSMDKAAAIAFADRVLSAAQRAKGDEASSDRIAALRMAHGLPYRGKTAEIDRVRSQLWDLVIDKDADETDALAPLIEPYLKDAEAAKRLAKKSKSPVLQAVCAFVPLAARLAQHRSGDLSESEVAALVADLKEFAKQHGEIVDPRRKLTWSAACEEILFPIEHLSIGAVAPEIEAADTSGVTFKLSDYRGKVVLLDFWGNW